MCIINQIVILLILYKMCIELPFYIDMTIQLYIIYYLEIIYHQLYADKEA